MVINSCLLSGKFYFQVLHPNSEEELVVQLEGTIIQLTITIVLSLLICAITSQLFGAEIFRSASYLFITGDLNFVASRTVVMPLCRKKGLEPVVKCGMFVLQQSKFSCSFCKMKFICAHLSEEI